MGNTLYLQSRYVHFRALDPRRTGVPLNMVGGIMALQGNSDSDESPLQTDTRRSLWITWGLSIIMVGLAFVIGGPFWGVTLISIGSVLVLRGHFPKLFRSSATRIVALIFVSLVVVGSVALSPFGRSLWTKKVVQSATILPPKEAQAVKPGAAGIPLSEIKPERRHKRRPPAAIPPASPTPPATAQTQPLDSSHESSGGPPSTV